MMAEALLLAAKVFLIAAVLPFVLLFALANAAVLVWQLIYEVWRGWPK
jgi:hypothetical protein